MEPYKSAVLNRNSVLSTCDWLSRQILLVHSNELDNIELDSWQVSTGRHYTMSDQSVVCEPVYQALHYLFSNPKYTLHPPYRGLPAWKDVSDKHMVLRYSLHFFFLMDLFLFHLSYGI